MNRHPLLRTALNIAVAVVAAGAAQATAAAISIDLHLGPGKEIGADSLQFGAAAAIGGVSVVSGSREAGPPSLSEITWSQQMDATYPLLLSHTLTGKTIDETTIELRSPGSAGRPAYLSLTTSSAGLTGVSFSNDSVTASMNYEKLNIAYDPAGLGKSGRPVVTGYDLTTGKAFGASSRAPTSYGGSLPASSGETEIYLRLGSGGTAIAGEANATGYENWIKLDSAQMGVGMVYTTPAGGPRDEGTPSVSDITLTQAFDAAVPALFGAVFGRTIIGDATIEYVTTDGAGPVTFMQLALENVILTSVSLSTGGDLPTVSESLNFTGFSQTVWEIESSGRRGKATTVGYNIHDRKVTDGKLAANVPGFGAGNLTGALTVSGASGDSGPVGAPVPEPATWFMMLAGVGVLTAAARRRATA